MDVYHTAEKRIKRLHLYYTGVANLFRQRDTNVIVVLFANSTRNNLNK